MKLRLRIGDVVKLTKSSATPHLIGKNLIIEEVDCWNVWVESDVHSELWYSFFVGGEDGSDIFKIIKRGPITFSVITNWIKQFLYDLKWGSL